MEQRVVSAVLAQLPRASMDVDSEGTHDPRVDHLEKEMHELKQHAQCLQESMSQHAADHNKQLHEVRDQMQQQGAHFEAAIASHASQLHAFQESFQEQFRQQSVNQQSMLDSMFHKQMSQFESLLAKRHRPE
jgi:DNA anti-recombination protein RmuC